MAEPYVPIADLTTYSNLLTELEVTTDDAETNADESPNKVCCEAYGYTWVGGETPYCYWKPQTDNGDPFAPQGLDAPEGE